MLKPGDIVEYTGSIPNAIRGSITERLMNDNLKIGKCYTISKVEFGNYMEWCELEKDEQYINFWYPTSSFICCKDSIKKKYNLK